MKRYWLLLMMIVCCAALAGAQHATAPQGCRRGAWQQPPQQRRAARPQRQPGGDYYVGPRHQLVVLAAFSDRTFLSGETETVALWQNIFNARGYSEPPFTGSVHDYFYDQSYGRFDLTFDIEYVALPYDHTKYASTRYDDENSKYLVGDIVDVLLTRDIDWSRYDWNADGYVNQLLIVYAGKGSSYGGFGGDSQAVWPHQYWLSMHTNSQPRTVGSGENTYTVDSYCAVQELFSDGSYATFGTICHEYSHCFGLPDFYVGGTHIVGGWDLMDYGNYNGDGFTPCGYSAHERWLMGWMAPTELSTPATIASMAPLGSEPQAYLIRNNARNDEYYIVENRQKAGWDAHLPGSGVVVFHIDYDPAVWVSTTVLANSPDRRYDLFHASNNTEESGWAYPYGGNSELTDLSVPPARLLHANDQGTLYMGKPLTNITVSEGIASFDFMGGEAAGIAATDACLDNMPVAVCDLRGQLLAKGNAATMAAALTSLHGICILRYADGQVRKVCLP